MQTDFYFMMAISSLLSFIFIKLIIKYADRFNLIDIPNGRSTHKHSTPRGAGIGIVLSTLISLFIWDISLFISYIWTFIGVLFIFGMGIWDDRHDVKPKTKFLLIIIATIFVSFDNITIETLGVYLGFDLSLGYFVLPFTILTVVSFTNAFNLIDGLDGLSGGIGVIIMTSLAYIGYEYGDEFILVISLLTIASLCTFLIFNWSPASIFMGDSGSLTLGFIISILSIKALAYIHPISIFYITAIPILDTIIVFVRRIRHGKSPFQADKSHIHHILLNFFKNNVSRTVSYLILIQILFTLAGLSNFMNASDGAVGIVVFCIILWISYMTFTGIYVRQQLIEEIKKCDL